MKKHSFKAQFYHPDTGYLIVAILLFWACLLGPTFGHPETDENFVVVRQYDTPADNCHHHVGYDKRIGKHHEVRAGYDLSWVREKYPPPPAPDPPKVEPEVGSPKEEPEVEPEPEVEHVTEEPKRDPEEREQKVVLIDPPAHDHALHPHSHGDGHHYHFSYGHQHDNYKEHRHGENYGHTHEPAHRKVLPPPPKKVVPILPPEQMTDIPMVNPPAKGDPIQVPVVSVPVLEAVHPVYVPHDVTSVSDAKLPEVVVPESDIVLTQVMFLDWSRGGGGNRAQWFELHNRGGDGNLKGWTLTFFPRGGGKIIIELKDCPLTSGETMIVTRKRVGHFKGHLWGTSEGVEKVYIDETIPNLKNRWVLTDPDGKEIYRRDVPWHWGWGSHTENQYRQAVDVIPSEPYTGDEPIYYGNPGDAGNPPGYHVDVAPKAPSQQRKLVTLWGALKQ